MNKIRLIASVITLIFFSALNAQKAPVSFEKEATYGSPDDPTLPTWVRKMYSADPNMTEVIALYKAYYKTHPFVKNQHTQYYKRWKKHAAPYVNENGLIRPPSRQERDQQQLIFREKRAQKSLKTTTGMADWQCVGPFDFDKDAAGTSHAPGAAHVYTLEQAPSNPDVLYCGTATAGVWKSSDHGNTWVNVTKNLPVNYCNAIEIHPEHPEKVWIGANDRLYYSADGGATWSETGDTDFNALSHDIHEIVRQPGAVDVLFVASDKGLYRSDDGGVHFTLVIPPNAHAAAAFTEIEIKPDDPNTIYAIQSGVNNQYTELYKSSDGGLSFILVSSWPVIASAATRSYFHIHKADDTADITFADDHLGTSAVPDFTIEMRLRIPQEIEDKALFSNKNYESGFNNGWIIASNPGGLLTFNVGNGTSRIDLTTSGIWDNQWHTIAVVYRSNGQKELYKDGVMAASSNTNLSLSETGLPMVLGKDGHLAFGDYEMDIDEIRIWNTPLSSELIASWKDAALNSTHPEYGHLLHYYPCTSLNGGILEDTKGTHNGTAAGSMTAALAQSFHSTTSLNQSDHQKRAEISVTPAHPDRIYALLPGKANGGNGLYGFYVSEDAGATWTHRCCGSGPGGPAAAITNPNLLGYSSTGDEDGGQYYYDLAMDADPGNADKVHIAGISHWYSLDAGVSFTLGGHWYPANQSGYTHADVHSIHIYGNEVWITSDGGIFMSQDSGKVSFQKRQYGIAGTEFVDFGMGHKDGKVMIGGAWHNSHLMKNHNVYENGWISYTGSADGVHGAVNPAQPTLVYNDGHRNRLSNDRTIAPVELPLNRIPNSDPLGRVAFDPRCYNGLYTGKDSDLWYSSDDGVTWELIYHFGNWEVGDVEVAWDDPNILWVTLADDVYGAKAVWRSNDRGATWADVTPVQSVFSYVSSMWFDVTLGTNSEEVWLTTISQYGWFTNNYRVLHSSDGGEHWVNWTTPMISGEELSYVMHQRGTNGGVYLGTERGVFYRNNEMDDWVPFDHQLPEATFCKKLMPLYKEGKIINATNRSVWESPFYEIGRPHAQPMADKLSSNCTRDTFRFADYSAHYGNAAFQWSFTPTPLYVSDATIENPKVVFGGLGPYSVTLTVSDAYGTSTKTITDMISFPTGSACDLSTVAGRTMDLAENGDYLLTPPINLNKNNGTATDSITLMAWIRPDAGIQQGYAGIITASGINVNLNFRSNNELGLHWNNSEWWWSSGITVPADEWSHVALVAAGTTLKLYLNGHEAAHPNFDPPALNCSDVQWYIGNDRGNPQRTFKGRMDEVCLYNRALSIAEIREKMHLIKDPASDASLKGYFQFDEINGPVWNKASLSSASLAGNATRTLSTAPVGMGTSARMTVTTGGLKSFPEQHLSLEFPLGGILPDGELVVTALNNAPDQPPPSGTPYTNQYWIIHNYGSQDIFDPLLAISFGGLNGFAAGDPNIYHLYKRKSGFDGDTWGQSIDAADQLLQEDNVTLTFGTGSDITTFSQFTINNENALAVELLHFDAVMRGSQVDLSWQVADETNVEYYTVEHSTNGLVFDVLTRTNKGIWRAVDPTPEEGISYYRLKIMEKGGIMRYSPIRSVFNEEKRAMTVSIYPNPVAKELHVDFETDIDQSIFLEWVNESGQTIHTVQTACKTGKNAFLFQTGAWPDGNYWLKITAGEKVWSNKVMIHTGK